MCICYWRHYCGTFKRIQLLAYLYKYTLSVETILTRVNRWKKGLKLNAKYFTLISISELNIWNSTFLINLQPNYLTDIEWRRNKFPGLCKACFTLLVQGYTNLASFLYNSVFFFNLAKKSKLSGGLVSTAVLQAFTYEPALVCWDSRAMKRRQIRVCWSKLENWWRLLCLLAFLHE